MDVTNVINQSKPKLRRMRTIKQILEEIKKDDPETPITRYLLKSIADTNNIYNVMCGNKHLYDFDLVLSCLGLRYD